MQNRFQLNVPDYIDTSKPLTEVEYRQAIADPNNKLELPLLHPHEDYPELFERNVPRRGDEVFEEGFKDFLQICIAREADEWPTDIIKKWSPYPDYDGELTKPLKHYMKVHNIDGVGWMNRLADSVYSDDFWPYMGTLLSWTKSQLGEGVDLKEGTARAGGTFLDHDAPIAETAGDLVLKYKKTTFWQKYADFGERNETVLHDRGYDVDRCVRYRAPNHPESDYGHYAMFASNGDTIRHHYDLASEINKEIYHDEYAKSVIRVIAGVHLLSSIEGQNDTLGREITY